MIVTFKCGDIVQNAFAGVKPSPSIVMKIESPWYWGHCILIDKTPLEKWKVGQTFRFAGIPNIDIANLGDVDNDIVIQFSREN